VILSPAEIAKLTAKYGQEWVAAFLAGTQAPKSEAVAALARAVAAAAAPHAAGIAAQ
jgi:hypothetical protein